MDIIHLFIGHCDPFSPTKDYFKYNIEYQMNDIWNKLKNKFIKIHNYILKPNISPSNALDTDGISNIFKKVKSS